VLWCACAYFGGIKGVGVQWSGEDGGGGGGNAEGYVTRPLKEGQSPSPICLRALLAVGAPFTF
jgi:hypothetical protein